MCALTPRPWLLACTLAAALVASHTAANQAAATGEPAGLTLLGSGFTGAPFSLGGDIVAESDSLRVTIRDMSVPSEPRVLGWLDHSRTCVWSEIVADGPLLVGLMGSVPQGVIGFSVVDIASPSGPVYHGDFSGMALDCGWLRDRALVATSGGLLVVYDLADLDTPVPSAFLPLGAHTGSRWPAAVGNVLFLVDHGATLRVLDVSDARHPVALATPALAGDRVDALVGGDGMLYALLATDVGGPGERIDLVTCDVSAPAAPVVTARLTLFAAAGATGRALAREGDLLVAAGSDGQVRAFGLADAAHPAAGWIVANAASRLVVTSGSLLVREGRDLLTYARTAWNLPPSAPVRRSPLPQLRTVVGEGPLQVAQFFRGSDLATVDVSDPFQPRLGSPIDVSASAPLQYAGGVGLMATEHGGRLIDLADPANPVLRGSLVWLDGHPVWRLWAPGLVTMENPTSGAAVWLFDTSDLDAPQVWGHVPEMGAFGAGDGLLAAGDKGGVRLYDIRDLGAPVLLAALTDPGAVIRAAFWRGHLYTSTARGGQHRLDTWDLTDRAAPKRVASAVLPAPADHLDRHGSRLYAQYEQGAAIFDLTDPGAPVPVGAPLWFNTRLYGFAVNGNVTTLGIDLITVRNDGPSTASAPRPEAPVAITLAPAWPNPCNPATSLSFTLDAERELALSVYDIRGRHVAVAAQGRFAAGVHEVTWSGTDDAGASVAAGVYLLRLHGAGVEAATTVTLIK